MLRGFMGFIALLVVSTTGLAQTPAPLDRNEIVVVGAKIADLKADVERCEAGGCTVREDVIATIRYAEAAFLEGKYLDAHTALGKAVSRTRKGEDSDPFAIVELQTARANVARHYGEPNDEWRAAGAVARIMERHAPQSPTAFMARLRLIDANFRRDYGDLEHSGGYNIAQLKTLSEEALEANYPLIALRADLSRASILYSTRQREDARALLDRIVASTVPDSAFLRLSAEILAMRLDLRDGNSSKVDALIARLSQEQKQSEPTLLWAPEMPMPQNFVHVGRRDLGPSPAGGGGSSYSTLPMRWVDIGFAIGSDGRVDSVEVLRGSSNPIWAKPLTAAIARRRYTPAASPDDLAGRYRIERYTMTADFVVPVGSRIRVRAGAPRFERIDFTPAPPTQAQAPAVTN